MMIKTLKQKVRDAVIAKNSSVLLNISSADHELRRVIASALDSIVSAEHVTLSKEEKDGIVSQLVDELIGFGPIEVLMRDPKVTEIMINGSKSIYAERSGVTELTGITFDDEKQLMQLVYKLLAPTRRRVDESNPYTEISLSDGSRVNIIIPPLALDGPTITIRRFLKGIQTLDDLIGLGTLNQRMSELLIALIKARANMVFSGATGVGKTTTLNVLSAHIPNNERIVTIEDTAELRLNQDHLVRLEGKQANIEGKGEISLRELFKNSLRMRPDRIILGEIRGQEALDMLQAICSGHNGSLVVLHANTPQDVVYRLETMILISGVAISLEAIHRQIAAAIDIIVQQEQFLDGSRKITHISQVNGIREQQVVIEDIFVYETEGLDAQGRVQGRWRATGIVPKQYPLFRKMGIELPIEIFNKD